MDPHHLSLLVGYSTALCGWLVAARFLRSLWPSRPAPTFAHPWWEVGFALLACVAIVRLGQGYVHGYKLAGPKSLHELVEAVNQVVIFAPMFLLLLLRRQGLSTAWLPTSRIGLRLLVGMCLALLAILAFTLTLPGSDNWLTVVPRVYRLDNLPYAVQVFCEDLAIAILFVRFQAALGSRLSIVLVAVLFAGAHLPTLIALGVPLRQTLFLFLDAGLGVLALLVLRRGQDIWWFWCVHFAMDMMQFDALPAPG